MKKFGVFLICLILKGFNLSFSQVGASEYANSNEIHTEGDREGTLTVIREVTKNTFKVLENFATLRGARTIAVNPKTHMIYLPVAEYEPAPAATAENPRPRPSIKANSFMVLEIKSL